MTREIYNFQRYSFDFSALSFYFFVTNSQDDEGKPQTQIFILRVFEYNFIHNHAGFISIYIYIHICIPPITSLSKTHAALRPDWKSSHLLSERRRAVVLTWIPSETIIIYWQTILCRNNDLSLNLSLTPGVRGVSFRG